MRVYTLFYFVFKTIILFVYWVWHFHLISCFCLIVGWEHKSYPLLPKCSWTHWLLCRPRLFIVVWEICYDEKRFCWFISNYFWKISIINTQVSGRKRPWTFMSSSQTFWRIYRRIKCRDTKRAVLVITTRSSIESWLCYVNW